MNGKLAALNKFINQLKELNGWAIKKKSEADEIKHKAFAERKLATEKLHVIFYYLYIVISCYFV